MSARDEGRRRAAELSGRGEDTSWFDRLYREAGRDTERVPWSDRRPHPRLVEWLDRHPASGRALVVGCGLGDDAEHLAARGLAVTAFDISPEAVRWCRERWPGSSVAYEVADLFAPPRGWLSSFDLVVEVYTVQALAPELHARALQALTWFPAPGGQIVVIARRAQPDDAPRDSPPWPIDTALVEALAGPDLELVELERLMDDEDPPVPRLVATLRRR